MLLHAVAESKEAIITRCLGLRACTTAGRELQDTYGLIPLGLSSVTRCGAVPGLDVDMVRVRGHVVMRGGALVWRRRACVAGQPSPHVENDVPGRGPRAPARGGFHVNLYSRHVECQWAFAPRSRPPYSLSPYRARLLIAMASAYVCGIRSDANICSDLASTYAALILADEGLEITVCMRGRRRVTASSMPQI